VNDYHCSFRILDSDNSLVAFSSKEVDMTMTMQLSDEELVEIATNVVKKVWGYDDISLVSHEETKWEHSDGTIYTFHVRGVMGKESRKFGVELSGKGETVSIGSYPKNLDYSIGVSMDEAKVIAEKFMNEDIMIRHILKEVNTEEGSPLELVSVYLSEEHLQIYILPMYIFEYEYRLDNPTVENFDCDFEIGIHLSNGKQGLTRVTPIIDNIDVIQKDEAEQLAIEHIAKNTEHKDISKYEMTHMQVDGISGAIEYHFRFDYSDEYSYSLTMFATGSFSSMQKAPRWTRTIKYYE
ncbi:MAG: hypothetical protein KAQ68_09470, partial [Clostridiales bacterium]|nr:hypothetical protein [Clostridiales bacterium]